jgi:hypothetical protein
VSMYRFGRFQRRRRRRASVPRDSPPARATLDALSAGALEVFS